jgi:hypothetical protein
MEDISHSQLSAEMPKSETAANGAKIRGGFRGESGYRDRRFIY